MVFSKKDNRKILKATFFTEFENRGLFSADAQQGRKGLDFQTP